MGEIMVRSYDIQDQLAGLSARRVAADVMSALEGHENEAEALRLLAERIPVRLAQIGKRAET
jgi:hypothetical protein